MVMRLDDAGYKKFKSEIAGGTWKPPGGYLTAEKYRKLTGKEFYPNLEEGVIGVNRNMRVLGTLIKVTSARVAADTALAVLRASQLRVPHDTGELKESGVVTFKIGFYTMNIAHGNRDYGSDNITDNSGRISPRRLKGVTKIGFGVQYIRINKMGEDIAVQMHEKISAYGGDSPAARKPGTGPKYLEIPFNMVSGRYIKDLKKSMRNLEKDIASISIVQKAAKSRWEVAQIRLDEGKALNKWTKAKYR